MITAAILDQKCRYSSGAPATKKMRFHKTNDDESPSDSTCLGKKTTGTNYITVYATKLLKGKYRSYYD